ncbi:dual specificity protein phosphatase 23 isoform X1 [Otolemur garnettii]|uniref:dual specificity protein phosphatase 23 isoform X1 n=1 Tax=Otolemur garnettii TaxID=30611 RepID=UPI000643F866|nr:dual specificity protein phosphatase 23 isoform X1 [Otolemur garnettii]
MGVQPPNFSWVLPGRLAGLALPRLPAHYQFLLDLGVRHLVSLTERGPPHSDSCPELTLHRLRIPDFCPPAPDQIDRFVQIVDQANARGEVSGRSWCGGGSGRVSGALWRSWDGGARAIAGVQGRDWEKIGRQDDKVELGPKATATLSQGAQ